MLFLTSGVCMKSEFLKGRSSLEIILAYKTLCQWERKKKRSKAHILNITKETSFDVTCTKQTTFKLKIGSDRLQNIQTMKTMVLNTVSVGVSIFKPPGEKFKLTYNYLLKRTNSLKHTRI